MAVILLSRYEQYTSKTMLAELQDAAEGLGSWAGSLPDGSQRY